MKALIILLFSFNIYADINGNDFDCDLSFNNQGFSCDLSYLEMTKVSIEALKADLENTYHQKLMPNTKGYKRYQERVVELSKLISDYSTCTSNFPAKHICGEDGYSQLSTLWDKLESLPKQTNDEIRSRNKVVSKYNALAKTYRACPKSILCNLKVEFIKEETASTQKKFLDANALGRMGNMCKAKFPYERFVGVYSKKTDKLIYTEMNNIFKLRPEITCLNSEKNLKTDRRINISIKGNKSQFTLIDDFADTLGPRRGMTSEPLGQIISFPMKPKVVTDQNKVTFKWGDEFLSISTATGKIENSNFLPKESFSSSCKTSAQGNKFFPNIKFNTKHKVSTIRG